MFSKLCSEFILGSIALMSSTFLYGTLYLLSILSPRTFRLMFGSIYERSVFVSSRLPVYFAVSKVFI